ncbi:MAG: class I tRNA ligase family protein [Clostridia bacterium]|nr:class I tRNA ligase family protein [Clostridia bacterium]
MDNNIPFERPRPIFPKRAVVTGGMPYGNKELHFAHFGGYMVHADAFARFLRDRIGSENVVFVSGTDCYGSPAMESFRKLKAEGKINYQTIEEFVKANHEKQKQTYLDYEIEHNFFGASGLEPAKSVHQEMSKYFIETLYKNKSIKLLGSLQFYDKKFKTLLNGRQVVGKCPIDGCASEKGYADECDCGHQYWPMELIDPVSTLSGEKPELVETANWYFKLEDYTDALKGWIDSIAKDKATRQFMVKEITEFLKKPEIYVKREYMPEIEKLSNKLPKFSDITANPKNPSVTLQFNSLKEREDACKVLGENQIRFRAGKTLVPFRLTGDITWGVPCPTIDGVSGQTFYVWPESLWAPISFTKTYLLSKGKPDDEWKKFWASKDAEVYQFIGEDNLYFYGPAQQAIWMRMNNRSDLNAKEGEFQPTHIIPSKHVLYLNVKASSSGSFKPPMAKDLLNLYTAEELRMHFLGMNLGNNNVSFMPKPLNPDAKEDEADVVVKEGSLLTNVYNRILRTLFYTIQNNFNSIVPVAKIDPEIKEVCKKAALDYERFMAEKKFHQVINCVDVFVRNISKYWANNVKDADNNEKLAALIANTLEQVRVANVLLHPIAPKGTENVAHYLNLKENWHNWDYIFDDVYTFFEDKNNHKFKTLKEREDFFVKHPRELAEIAKRNEEQE